ncbi:hypothetical protein LC612_35475 [Nostoc sp. CHAB 5834]|nr:hypothetical protein [Nostoc sp. CHAB 5834]
MTKSVIAELSAIPEKFLEKGVKASQGESVGCLYQYLETKKLLDGKTVSYPRVIGERDPNNPFHWRWAFNWKVLLITDRIKTQRKISISGLIYFPRLKAIAKIFVNK